MIFLAPVIVPEQQEEYVVVYPEIDDDTLNLAAFSATVQPEDEPANDASFGLLPYTAIVKSEGFFVPPLVRFLDALRRYILKLIRSDSRKGRSCELIKFCYDAPNTYDFPNNVPYERASSPLLIFDFSEVVIIGVCELPYFRSRIAVPFSVLYLF